MKLSPNKYYVEKYLKCRNCGALLFAGQTHVGSETLFCSAWCNEWSAQKARGIASPQIPLGTDAGGGAVATASAVDISVIEGLLTSICREMGINLMRTAYSSLFSESEDFSCGLATPTGELIANGDHCPSQIGGIPLLVRTMIQETPLDTIEEGDVILHNDPYRGGCTLQSILSSNLSSSKVGS